MSKASEYVIARDRVQSWSGASGWAAAVESDGRCWINHEPVCTTMTPEEALSLAAWLIDMFGEGPADGKTRIDFQRERWGS